MYKTCEICGCNENETSRLTTVKCKFKKILCEKHYTQMLRYGFCLDRTRNDINKIIKYADYAEICIYNNKNLEIARGKIDLDDVEKCKQYKWSLSHGYLICRQKNMNIHRFLLNIDNDCSDVIDHVDGNPLNNRKDNLRKCTQQQNTFNSKIYKNNTSGITGVRWSDRYNKWEVFIHHNYKSIYLGRFVTKEEAIKVRKEAEQKYFGQFTRNHQKL